MSPFLDTFLSFDPTSELSFEDKSSIYSALVALMKAEYPFDNACQDRAAKFLKRLKSTDEEEDDFADQLVAHLVHSSSGAPSDFLASIITLLSSPYPTIVVSALSFLTKATMGSSLELRYRIMESDVITKVFAIFQPHSLPIAGNAKIFKNLLRLPNNFCIISLPGTLLELYLTTAVDPLKLSVLSSI
ncbi:hypothetical protein BLNAU_2117 [Blattamonas nauphoetae]|uniref:MMS19 nucleotide excision repair protein n=1 Tax=Blattamonas nauphoetae TaxID=2049346 RepID=A0ABQ9YHM4_9EUKA|nr:hypothetical protein BLNAU_2117 [Blattamonas nauphoetae]